MSASCRCGFNGEGSHPCHGKEHACRQPATQRFYDPKPAILSGTTMKYVMVETWACDACWDEFSKMLKLMNAPRVQTQARSC